MLCQFQLHSKVYLMYSKVNQLYVYRYPLFKRFFSHIGHYKVLSRVPCSMQQAVISYLFCVQQGVYVSLSLPCQPSSRLYPLVTRSLFSTSVNLPLFCKCVHLYLFFFFKDSTYKQYRMISVFVCPTSLSLTISRSIHIAANDIIFSFLLLSNIPLFMHTISFLCIPQLMDIQLL